MAISVILQQLYQKTQKNKLESIFKIRKESEVGPVEKAYKYRIYPNRRQKELMAKTFECYRFVYNKFGYGLSEVFQIAYWLSKIQIKKTHKCSTTKNA